MQASEGKGHGCGKPSAFARLRAWAPLLTIVALSLIVLGMGWHQHLSLRTIGLNYEALHRFIGSHFLAALSTYALAYIAIVALSLPGGLIMTLAGGLLFGWVIAAPVSVVGATIGATIVFLAAKTSLGETLAEKAAPWLCKLREGFKANAFSYLLFLRLVPAFPFCAVNLVPALLNVPLHTFVLATFFGIIPGTYAIAFAGSGLASVIEAQNAMFRECVAQNQGNEAACPYHLETGALFTKEILIAFVLLGIVALIPVVIKWSKRNASA